MQNKSTVENYDGIEYILTVKRVKNINLRVAKGGAVHVSAPRYVSRGQINAFISSRKAWILNAQNEKILEEKQAQTPFPFTKAECLEMFLPVSDKIYPIFEDILGGQKPIIKVRLMKTRWGVCHVAKRVITLNMRLAERPQEALEYVVMHEYAHFVHANHGRDFHALMQRLMPDYKARKALLK
ncbi:MAG: SprT-like domain-containing protein [Oscillospiraceae bacterium]